ncbi:hypothetical protein KDA_51660 [Dictyobacter alpinus]|uniref:Uncharacterized protein n=1 Tax=Dictyobacter alpinus TaxID=2014873 RepID=A0A402BEG2_9CHLR|nr:hypothetical protein KDA_51660 [Dictyobacter alpinus]
MQNGSPICCFESQGRHRLEEKTINRVASMLATRREKTCLVRWIVHANLIPAPNIRYLH